MGIQGPIGPNGTQGIQGPPGPNQILPERIYLVIGSDGITNNTSLAQSFSNCDPGDIVIGGFTRFQAFEGGTLENVESYGSGHLPFSRKLFRRNSP